MKYFLIFITLFLTLSFSCKTKQKSENCNNDKQKIAADDNRIEGKVSFQYRSGGCATVIIVKQPGKENVLTLIPSLPLAKEFDIDGLTIKFNYHPLKMRNPDGCTVGIPAEITDLSK